MTSLTSTNVFTISCWSIEPPPPRASVNLVLQHGAKPCKVSIALFVDYSYYSSTIRGLFVLFVDYSRTIRTIRRLFADYSHYSSTIRRLFVLFVDYSHYSHYSLHYSSFINCPMVVTDIALTANMGAIIEIYCSRIVYATTISHTVQWKFSLFTHSF